MSRIGIVCDSTSDLDPSWYAEHDVRMVPLKVLFGDESFLDWTEMPPERFFERLVTSKTLPKTSQPSPADFLGVYEQLAAEGCERIVTITLTSALSGTYSSASMAADDASVPVHVVDTRLVSQATALVLKAAVEARDAGAMPDDVIAAAERTVTETRLFFVLDTLEYLVKGGRAGKATGLAASLLDIKPVLTFTPQGEVAPFAKVKGLKKAYRKLAEHVAEDAAANGRMRLSILHGCAPERAEAIAAALAEVGADVEIESIGLVGSVIGTYAGPGAGGVAYHPLG